MPAQTARWHAAFRGRLRLVAQNGLAPDAPSLRRLLHDDGVPEIYRVWAEPTLRHAQPVDARSGWTENMLRTGAMPDLHVQLQRLPEQIRTAAEDVAARWLGACVARHRFGPHQWAEPAVSMAAPGAANSSLDRAVHVRLAALSLVAALVPEGSEKGSHERPKA